MTLLPEDTVNAFISTFIVPGAAAGPLDGLTFGAKDLYDIAGMVTGCGNPDWARSHAAAQLTAPAVLALMDAGATLVGKTHTDEIAYSLMGVNAHYGTPINSLAPDRVPGGSSSGSVAATAAGLIDIGLGSDTGGSVRLPAAFCGVFGIRTTHGRIDLSCTMALAPSFDTVGWFAREATTLAAAGAAYGIEVPEQNEKLRLLIAKDAMALSSRETRSALRPAIDKFEEAYGPAREISISDTTLSDWRSVFMICQAAEIWQVHGDWVTKVNPSFGPGVKERFSMASQITADMQEKAEGQRAEIVAKLTDLLGDDGVILLPTGPGPAPYRDADDAGLNGFRMSALELLCPAGLAGLPQVSVPAGFVDGGPVGLSLISARGHDGRLLAMAGVV